MNEFKGLDNRTVQQLMKLRETNPELFNQKGELVQTGLGQTVDVAPRRVVERKEMDRLKIDPGEILRMQQREENARKQSALGAMLDEAKFQLWDFPLEFWKDKLSQRSQQ